MLKSNSKLLVFYLPIVSVPIDSDLHSKHWVKDNSLIMSCGLKTGRLPSVIRDHFEEDVIEPESAVSNILGQKFHQTIDVQLNVNILYSDFALFFSIIVTTFHKYI